MCVLLVLFIGSFLHEKCNLYIFLWFCGWMTEKHLFLLCATVGGDRWTGQVSGTVQKVLWGPDGRQRGHDCTQRQNATVDFLP